jgi:hypothetical protein
MGSDILSSRSKVEEIPTIKEACTFKSRPHLRLGFLLSKQIRDTMSCLTMVFSLKDL